MDRPDKCRHLAEEHGKCAVDFIRAGIEPLLCYEQAVIAAYFGRLHLASQERLPDLEAQAPGTCCPDCGEATEVKGFCGVCADRKPMTFDGFLSYAVSSCVNGGSR